MKNLFVLLSVILLITLNYSCKKKTSDCVCIEIYQPVCGDDGVEYANSCKADCAGVSYTDGFCSISTQAKVLDEGAVALDGCDWVLEFEVDGVQKQHHPDELPSSFQQDQLEVTISYKPTFDIFTCGLTATEIPVIELISIE